MVKCNNCGNTAAYTNTDLGGNHTHYCVECLPAWLQKRAQAGEFPLVTRIEDDVKEAEPKAASKRKKALDEKPAVEVAETPVEEAPAPAEEAPADENN